jgi:prepilin signal peptidase PulO-like enzyme (type II secretory pathway)
VDIAVALAAAVIGFAAGWAGAMRQHLLYQNPEYRDSPATGRRALAFRLFAAAATGAVAGLAFRPDYYDFWPALLTAVFGFVLVLCASTDFERRIIPNRLTYPAAVAAAALCWAWPDRSVTDVWLGAAFALGIAVALFLFGELIRVVLGLRATAFGVGDVKLIVVIGLIVGWPAILEAGFIGVLAGGLVSFTFIVRRRWRATFSYGPYLALGGIIVMLWLDRFS